MSDRESLDEKIERLESEQEDLKDTVSKMLPSRRSVLKGAATAAGASALGFSAGNASAQASTSDNDGNIGTPSNRVDLFADGVDSNSVSTEELSIGVAGPNNTVSRLVGEREVRRRFDEGGWAEL